MKIKVSLGNLDEAIRKVEAYRDRVKSAETEILSALVEKGVEIAKDNASYMNIYDTGELVNGIVGEVSDGKGYIRSTAPHSAYCEFGTGIRGKESQHPNPGIAGWKYDINEHGEEGWWYWKNGEWHWTAGMPSRPFMYNTAEQLRQIAPGIAKEVLQKGVSAE